jgi:hypothetical protein
MPHSTFPFLLIVLYYPSPYCTVLSCPVLSCHIHCPVINRCYPLPLDKNASDWARTEGDKYGLDDSVPLEYGASRSETYLTTFFVTVWFLRGYIFGFGLGVSILVAFIYIYVLRIPGFLFWTIWSILLAVLALLFVGAWLLWDKANRWSDDENRTDTEVNLMYVVTYIVFALCVLYVCFLVVMRKRINLAIGIVKEAARALASMPAILLLPLVQAVGLLLFLVPWTAYVIFLASSGDVVTVESEVDPNVKYRTFDYDTNTKYAFFYLLFTYYWTSEFIIALGQLTVAASFAGWYFTREKSLMMNSIVVWVSNAMLACLLCCAVLCFALFLIS